MTKLQFLLEEKLISIEKIILQFQNKLLLNNEETLVLLFFLEQNKKKFSFQTLMKKFTFSSEQASTVLESLIQKKCLIIEEKKINNKKSEIINTDNFFFRIDNLLQEELEKKHFAFAKDNISECLEFLEEKLKKNLSSFELSTVKHWYFQDNFSHQKIMNLLKQQHQFFSINFLDRLLRKNTYLQDKLTMNQNNNNRKINHKMLETIFKKI